MPTYVYVMDIFDEVKISLDKVATTFEKDPMLLFEEIKGQVEKRLGYPVIDVKFCDSYLNPETGVVVVEYMVRFQRGVLSVKLIHAKNPISALEEYYRNEKRIKYE